MDFGIDEWSENIHMLAAGYWLNHQQQRVMSTILFAWMPKWIFTIHQCRQCSIKYCELNPMGSDVGGFFFFFFLRDGRGDQWQWCAWHLLHIVADIHPYVCNILSTLNTTNFDKIRVHTAKVWGHGINSHTNVQNEIVLTTVTAQMYTTHINI